MQSTAALNDKMKDFSDNAMKFQMDGGISAYEYKDQDEPEDHTDYKSLAGELAGHLCLAFFACISGPGAAHPLTLALCPSASSLGTAYPVMATAIALNICDAEHIMMK